MKTLKQCVEYETFETFEVFQKQSFYDGAFWWIYFLMAYCFRNKTSTTDVRLGYI